jgi:hypothetical protein
MTRADGTQTTRPSQQERSATRAVDLYKGMDTGRFDPERSDHVHGRAGAPALLFDRMKGVKVFGCEACVFGERYEHTCGLPEPDAPIFTFTYAELEASC